MEQTIKVKDLTLGFIEETCRKHDCYYCPLNKLDLPCQRIPQLNDKVLEQEIKLHIEVIEDE